MKKKKEGQMKTNLKTTLVVGLLFSSTKIFSQEVNAMFGDNPGGKLSLKTTTGLATMF